MTAIAMFPLGSVLFPGGALGLHVFEPRYRDMVRACLAADGPAEFGQVLITRGREVGGGDQRAMVGTVARMIGVDALAADRYRIIAVGDRRIRVVNWLPDRPYPLAEILEWPDIVGDAGDVSARLVPMRDRVAAVAVLAREVAAMREDVPAEAGEVSVSDDPVLASYQLATLAPIGPADRLRLLAAPGPSERLVLLGQILDEVEAMLRFQLR